MRVLGAEPSAYVFERHADFQRSLPGNVSITFHWRPFPENTTALITKWRYEKKPTLVVTTTSLWHMLYYTDADLYRTGLDALLSATRDMMPKLASTAKPHLILATGTEIHPQLLTAPAKREAMTPARVDAYNAALQASSLLAPRGPYGMLDMFSMTYGKPCLK